MRGFGPLGLLIFFAILERDGKFVRASLIDDLFDSSSDEDSSEYYDDSSIADELSRRIVKHGNEATTKVPRRREHDEDDQEPKNFLEKVIDEVADAITDCFDYFGVFDFLSESEEEIDSSANATQGATTPRNNLTTAIPAVNKTTNMGNGTKASTTPRPGGSSTTSPTKGEKTTVMPTTKKP